MQTQIQTVSPYIPQTSSIRNRPPVYQYHPPPPTTHIPPLVQKYPTTSTAFAAGLLEKLPSGAHTFAFRKSESAAPNIRAAG